MRFSSILRLISLLSILAVILISGLFLPSHVSAQTNYRAYVANQVSNNLSVIDTSSQSVLNTISAGSGPIGITVTSDGSKAYVVNENGNNVYIINTTTGNLITTIQVGSFPFFPSGITPSGHLYVPNYGSNTVSVIDSQTDTLLTTIQAGQSPTYALLSLDGSKVYVANNFGDSVSVFDTSTNTIVATISGFGPGHPGPGSLEFSPDGNKLYVSLGDSMGVVDTATNTIVENVNIGMKVDGIAAVGNKIYTADDQGNQVVVLDANTYSVLATISVGAAPTVVRATPDGSQVYVSNGGSGDVSIIDTSTDSVVATVTVGSGPQGIWFASAPPQNQVPVVGGITVSPNPETINTNIAGSASFTDANAGDTHTATWNWGDNNTSSGSIMEPSGATPGSVTGSHQYVTPGVYTITLSVSDGTGAGTSIFEYLSVYDPQPNSHFGAARIFTSPAGAYLANTNLTGQVKFGVQAKYSGTNSQGSVNMDFSAANFKFDATSISSLVVANNKATLRGNGTVNGSGNYTFLITGLDGSGGGGKIRFQIKDSGGNTVYDTQPGATDVTNPTASVTGSVRVQ